MNKRNFIKLSVLAAAGLVLPRTVLAETGRVYVPEPMYRVNDEIYHTNYIAKVIEFGYYPDQGSTVDNRILLGKKIICQSDMEAAGISCEVESFWDSRPVVGVVSTLWVGKKLWFRDEDVDFYSLFATLQVPKWLSNSWDENIPALSPVINKDSGKLERLQYNFSVTAQSYITIKDSLNGTLNRMRNQPKIENVPNFRIS